jgi:uncharacterized protein YfiM (DUF2279 family)
MRRVIAVAALALLSAAASLACTAKDRWTGEDKVMHVTAGGVIAVAAGSQLRDPWAGFAAGVAAGAAKELYDRRHPGAHTCSLQDFVVTAVGAAFGAYGSKVAIETAGRGVAVRYSTTF